MKISYELDIKNFEAWSGAVDTLETIIAEGKADELEALLEDCYPEGMTETQLNDLLWFEEEWLFKSLGIRTKDNIREELEEAKEELEELLNDYLTDCMDFEEKEAEEFYAENYADDVEELEERIKELEEELENI